jgi:hypothetical protein
MDLKSWCKNQADEAKKYKWCKGVELGSDPGEQAVVEWVNTHARTYRKEYNECLSNISLTVFNLVKSKMTTVDEVLLHQITDLVIEEFTKEWTKEASLDIKHIYEI